MKATEVFNYLNRKGLADQVHFRGINQIVFYHWNRGMTDLEPSITIENNRIERLYYPRKVMPLMYMITPQEIENDFEDQQYIRDYRESNE